MSISIQITGLEHLQQMFDPGAFIRTLDTAVDRSAEFLRDDTKRMPAVSAKTTGYGVPGIPVDSGRMRQAIVKRKVGLLAAGVFADTNYSAYVHDGTGKKPAQPFFQDELETFGGKEGVKEIVTSTLQQLFG